MNRSELPNELVDRGIYWQFGGFTLVALASTVILAEFAGSDRRMLLYFEIAATKLYWAFVIPLAVAFDGVRKMFEKMSEYRAKRKARWLDEGRREGHREGLREGRREGRRVERERMLEEMERLGVALPQEAVAYLEGETDDATP